MRATVKMNDGATLDEKKITEAIEGKKLTYISTSPATSEAPKVVYVLNVSGVG
jgi:hypothetical protein